MTDIKLTNKMNETVKEMLQLRNDPISLYALTRIEELEKQIKLFAIPVITKRCCEDCKYYKIISDNNFDSNDVGYKCDKGKFDGYNGDGSDIENNCDLFNAL